MTVSVHDLPSLPHVAVRPTPELRDHERPGMRDWIAALAWTAALVGAHLLLFAVVLLLVAVL